MRGQCSCQDRCAGPALAGRQQPWNFSERTAHQGRVIFENGTAMFPSEQTATGPPLPATP